jgi:hypothetical protein
MSLDDPATLETFLSNMGNHIKQIEALLLDIKAKPANYEATASYQAKQELAIYRSIYSQALLFRAPKVEQEKKEGE